VDGIDRRGPRLQVSRVVFGTQHRKAESRMSRRIGYGLIGRAQRSRRSAPR
jgi:hypothetical protein